MDYIKEAYNKFLENAIHDIKLIKRLNPGFPAEFYSALIDVYIEGHSRGRLALSPEFEAVGQKPKVMIKKDLLEKLGEE